MMHFPNKSSIMAAEIKAAPLSLSLFSSAKNLLNSFK